LTVEELNVEERAKRMDEAKAKTREQKRGYKANWYKDLKERAEAGDVAAIREREAFLARKREAAARSRRRKKAQADAAKKASIEDNAV
jgi:hypothetical protein